MIKNNQHYLNNAPYAVPENGFIVVYTPKGELMEKQISAHVKDSLDDFATCTIEILVNICTKDEMLEDIERKNQAANTVKTSEGDFNYND